MVSPVLADATIIRDMATAMVMAMDTVMVTESQKGIISNANLYPEIILYFNLIGIVLKSTCFAETFFRTDETALRQFAEWFSLTTPAKTVKRSF